MLQSWRWYGKYDKLSLFEIAQTGAKSIVTSLHEVPYGEVWSSQDIRVVADQIREGGFEWSVVESLPIHEDIKRGEGNLTMLFANYRQSMANLAAEGVQTICYNFMPLLDWTRTDLVAPVAGGGTCLRFSNPRMAAFEICMLQREDAEADYSAAVIADAKSWFDQSHESERAVLLNSIMAGLPGAFERFDIAGLKNALAQYKHINRSMLRDNYLRFLQEVLPAAVDLGISLCVHPDDPPRDILGLPRVVSNETDIAWILDSHVHRANGLTLCSGSLGANPANNVPVIAGRFAERIHFAHLRNVRNEHDGSFEEAAHLDGDTDMVAVVKVLVAEEVRRKAVGREDYNIPFRPDHGHELLTDALDGTHPGYPMIGRLKGLAELRGVVAALTHSGE